jgi:hypothetical protein
MGHLGILSRTEIESLGPPNPEEMADTGIPSAYLCDLALKHIAMLPEPTTNSVADRLHLPRALTEELLYHLYREKLIEMRLQSAVGSTRYAMLDHGWERVSRLQTQSGYLGPAPVSLTDYSYMMRLQAVPSKPASIDNVRSAFNDLVLPDSLLETLGCVINSRSSLFLTGLPGTGKTAVSERMNAALSGSIWIPHAIEVDGQIIRVFDSHCHKPVTKSLVELEHDRRWVEIERPLIIVGGELTIQDADLVFSDTAKFYEAPFQVKSNGGTLVIDDFGRQRMPPQELLNRWILPLERRIDFLTLHSGKKIEVPFEQLVVFSTNLNEDDLVDEAFLRRMGYRARIEPPSRHAFVEIFQRAAQLGGFVVDPITVDYILGKYHSENRMMKSCEPRDLLRRITDICVFHGRSPQITTELVDVAWNNYFGHSHGFGRRGEQESSGQSITATVSIQ